MSWFCPSQKPTSGSSPKLSLLEAQQLSHCMHSQDGAVGSAVLFAQLASPCLTRIVLNTNIWLKHIQVLRKWPPPWMTTELTQLPAAILTACRAALLN